MSRYRKVEVSTWGDQRFRELSSPIVDTKLLWLYLLTGPRTTVFPGMVLATEAVISSDLRWPVDPVLDLLGETFGTRGGTHPRCLRDAWKELSDRGMVRVDWDAGVIVLTKALFDSNGRARESAKPGSPNALAGWAKSWPEVPDCKLKTAYLKDLELFVGSLNAGYMKAFRIAFAGHRKCVPDASPTRGGTRGGTRLVQEQEQDQDQDQEEEKNSLSRASSTTEQTNGADPHPLLFAVPALQPSPPRDIDPALQMRQRLVQRFFERVNEARRDIAVRHKLPDVSPIALHGGERESELRHRIADAGDDAERQLEHVVTVAIAEADTSKSVRWLGWSIGRSWTTLLEMTPADVRKAKREGPRSVYAKQETLAGRPREKPFPPMPQGPELTDDDRAEMEELRARLAEDPISAAARLAGAS